MEKIKEMRALEIYIFSVRHALLCFIAQCTGPYCVPLAEAIAPVTPDQARAAVTNGDSIIIAVEQGGSNERLSPPTQMTATVLVRDLVVSLSNRCPTMRFFLLC